MAKHKLSQSNQKRYFARFYLEAIENTENDESILNRKALLMAHRQSCLFHLVGAYRAFIWEVANTYDESYVATQSLQELLLQARANGKVVTELERVYELESTSGSWLQAMMKMWERINAVDPDATTQAKETMNLNAIEVRVVSETDDFTQLHDWYENLSSLIEEIRQLLSEW
ncbi:MULTISPECIES: DUF6586 family protein [unclassified Ketobacter]|uniref:DUF6586 family protein n=1 Tax=unclassified Ketobacter TaxID=2639109 RepID=UPI000F0ED969|nr:MULTISPECIES: DUF6586 family protein [unclassified Ketobacter]RLT88794.1 MAG: hypothetical protein D9N13_16645 [Ketobacter sp. GenoA1]RLT97605.1 MAG: hypothetical protein D9N15_07295 [Ketobacter sp.]